MINTKIRFGLWLSLFIFSACSSTEVQNANTSKTEQPVKAVVKNGPVDKTVPEIKHEEKIASSQYSELNNAIKNKNDETIQKAASEILAQNSNDLAALNALAMVYYKKSRYEAAQYLLKKALAANPDSSETYSNRGLVLMAEGEKREAIQAFRKAIEININNATAGANVGSIYVQEKDFGKAVIALEIAVKNGQTDYKVMTNYAIALAATGKTKQAADIYEKLLKDNPGQKEVMLDYSILMIDVMQKYKDGLDLLNRLKFVGSLPDTREIIKQLEIKAKAGLQ